MPAVPASWPPRPATGVRSIRFYVTGTATGLYTDNSYMFAEGTGANTFVPTPYIAPGEVNTQVLLGGTTAALPSATPMGAGRDAHDSIVDPKASPLNADFTAKYIAPPPLSQIWAFSIRVTATAQCTISFDGTNDQGIVLANTSVVYERRHESGIAIKGSGTFYIEAW